MLEDQVGKIRAYKLVDEHYKSPIQSTGKLVYKVGSVVEMAADTDENIQCSYGLNVASLDWCIREWTPGRRILLIEFDREDLACIPLMTDGKFRVHKLTVLKELNLQDLGLNVGEPKVSAA